MPKSLPTSRAEMKRIGKFGLIGIFNTVLDFVVYNFMQATFGVSPVVANLVSTTIAMVFSYFANRHIVFERGTRSLAKQLASFYLVTAFGVYVLQSVVIYFLIDVWHGPAMLAVSLAVHLGLHHSNTLIIRNAAKLVATVVSLIWNYVMYKRVVFQ